MICRFLEEYQYHEWQRSMHLSNKILEQKIVMQSAIYPPHNLTREYNIKLIENQVELLKIQINEIKLHCRLWALIQIQIQILLFSLCYKNFFFKSNSFLKILSINVNIIKTVRNYWHMFLEKTTNKWRILIIIH